MQQVGQLRTAYILHIQHIHSVLSQIHLCIKHYCAGDFNDTSLLLL